MTIFIFREFNRFKCLLCAYVWKTESVWRWIIWGQQNVYSVSFLTLKSRTDELEWTHRMKLNSETIDWFNNDWPDLMVNDCIDRFPSAYVEWKQFHVASVGINLTLFDSFVDSLSKTMQLNGPPSKRCCTENSILFDCLCLCLWVCVFTFPLIFTFDKCGHIEERYIFPYGVDRDYNRRLIEWNTKLVTLFGIQFS